MRREEGNIKYQMVVQKLAEMISAKDKGARPTDALMLACDVAVAVIWDNFDTDEERLGATNLFITRLGTQLDNKRSEGLQLN